MEPIVEKKPAGFLADGNGDLSSGRLIKVYSFFTAAGVAIVGTIVMGVLTYLGKGSEAGQLSTYLLGVVGMLLGVAAGTEITQKLTGR